MKVSKGLNHRGDVTLRFELPRNDPRAKLIRYLTSRGSSAVQDPQTGFVREEERDESAALELEHFVLSMLPEEAQEMMIRACADAVKRAEEERRHVDPLDMLRGAGDGMGKLIHLLTSMDLQSALEGKGCSPERLIEGIARMGQ